MSVSIVEIPNTPYWQPALNNPGEVVTGIYDVAQDVQIVVLTVPGSVTLLPEFGVDWLAILDRPMPSALRMAERVLLKALRRWVTRIDVVSVKTESIDEITGSVAVCVTWKLKGSDDAVIQVLGFSRSGVAA